jgi:hypothetical protein
VKIFLSIQLIIILAVISFSCNKKQNTNESGLVQLAKVTVGSVTLSTSDITSDVPVNKTIEISFNVSIDSSTVEQAISLLDDENIPVALSYSFNSNKTEITLTPLQTLKYNSLYILQIEQSLKGINNESFPGIEYQFQTENGILSIESILLNGNDFSTSNNLQNIPLDNSTFEVEFNFALDESNYKNYFSIIGFNHLETSLSNDNKTVTAVISQQLSGLQKYYFNISAGLTSEQGYSFNGFSNFFYSAIDSTPKFPPLSDEDLLTLIQEQTFKFYWDYAHPVCGLSRERLGSGDIVTSGGSGFGLMALIVGTERGFISRTQLIDRLETIITFLESSDRFHGAWPHWLNGSTGKVQPFSTNDDGADLVETAFLVQGLITIRQYLNQNTPEESGLIDRINILWQSVEWDWFTRDENVLYWHWSPDKEWIMNMAIRGYNEASIVYILAASSTTHTIDADVYHEGYMRSGGVINDKDFYGITLPLGYDYGGPLFFAHYSFLGLDPRNLQDQYANYWEQNRNHTLINRAYCINNPKQFLSYSEKCWGLTASDNHEGYNAHSPTNDLGVITPTAAISSLPYTPEESMEAIKFFYYTLGDKLWGEYGFFDAFNATEGWWADSYISIDQGPIICMIENYRTALLWDLFMSAPEVQSGLTKLGFSY